MYRRLTLIYLLRAISTDDLERRERRHVGGCQHLLGGLPHLREGRSPAEPHRQRLVERARSRLVAVQHHLHQKICLSRDLHTELYKILPMPQRRQSTVMHGFAKPWLHCLKRFASPLQITARLWQRRAAEELFHGCRGAWTCDVFVRQLRRHSVRDALRRAWPCVVRLIGAAISCLGSCGKQSVVSASRREVKVLQEHTHMPSAPFPMPWALLRLPPPSALRR